MMKPTDELILNPCPICGCSVRVWAKRCEEDIEYIIECDNDFCGLTYGISCGYNREEIEKAWNNVTALSPTVSEDCISRPAVIEDIKANAKDLTDALIILENFPSDTFKPPYEKYMCNKCGERGTSAWSFCPNCGADMR